MIRSLRGLLVATAALCALTSPALAQNITIKDGNGSAVTMCTMLSGGVNTNCVGAAANAFALGSILDLGTGGTLHNDLTNLATTPIPAGSPNTVIGATAGALRTAGGWTPKLLNGLTTTLVQIKASAGQLGMLQCYNSNSAQIYVQVLDSTSPTLGTTTPVLSIPIAPGATGGVALSLVGVQFNNAIQVAATTTATGSTAPSTALDCNALFN